jgi:hyperpolarization activated cyclic nucleotide-gated potassium channel 1
MKIPTFIHPEGNFKRIWSFIIMIFMIYVGSIMPYKMAFFDDDESGNFTYFDLIADFVFLIDVFINSFSGFYNADGVLIESNRKIFSNYLSGWFIIDVCASAPMTLVDLVLNNQQTETSKYNSIIRLFRLPRLYRLVQVTRISKVLTGLKKNSIFI